MKIRSIRQAKVTGKRVLMRVDYNVPLSNGKVSDDTRIRETLPTINFLLKKKAEIILMSHLGRPDGKVKKDMRLDPVAKQLSKLLKKKVTKLDDCVGPKVEKAVSAMKPGDVILLENTRFHAEEEKCDKAFSKQLAKLGDIYAVDAFGTAHRAHASTYGISLYLPAYAGFLMEKEVKVLSELMQKTKHPLTLIVGGAKIDTKIGLLKNFMDKADNILVGGALASTFLAAQGFDVGKSLCEKDKLDIAREIMLDAETLKKNFVLPEDVIVADEISDKAVALSVPDEDVEGNMQILDIGQKTIKNFLKIIWKSKTVVWNGPVGVFEKKPFAKGTSAIARALAGAKKTTTILGGGDTVDAINHLKISAKKFTHVSTGGGAMLEFLEGRELPGVKIILT
jgi:phosphoglycerate kinase